MQEMVVMIDKRFTLEPQFWKTLPQGQMVVDHLTKRKGFTLQELCDIASDLHCEVEVYKNANWILVNQNKGLKQELKFIKSAIDEAIENQKTTVGREALKEIIGI